jgi:hypothetical protein
VLQTTPNIARVTNSVAFSGTQSYELQFNFINDTPAGSGTTGNWLRLTSNNTATLGNPAIGVPNTGAPAPGTASLRMQIRVVAVPEPASVVLLALAMIIAVSSIRGRNAGHYVAA